MITSLELLLTGLALIALLAFQNLLGLRKIKLKGTTHRKVHKWVGFAILAGAIVHGIMAARFLGLL